MDRSGLTEFIGKRVVVRDTNGRTFFGYFQESKITEDLSLTGRALLLAPKMFEVLKTDSHLEIESTHILLPANMIAAIELASPEMERTLREDCTCSDEEFGSVDTCRVHGPQAQR